MGDEDKETKKRITKRWNLPSEANWQQMIYSVPYYILYIYIVNVLNLFHSKIKLCVCVCVRRLYGWAKPNAWEKEHITIYLLYTTCERTIHVYIKKFLSTEEKIKLDKTLFITNKIFVSSSIKTVQAAGARTRLMRTCAFKKNSSSPS